MMKKKEISINFSFHLKCVNRVYIYENENYGNVKKIKIKSLSDFNLTDDIHN